MRISVFQDDPGFKNLVGNFDVYLDDRLIANCYTADTELGEIVMFDAEAAVEKFGEIPTKIVHGTVRIEPHA